VGTKLTTGQPDAALAGIYKLSAMRPPGEQWRYRIKLSDEPAKTSCPGLLQVRRFHEQDRRFIADAIYEIDHAVSEPCVIVDLQTQEQTEIQAKTEYADLLIPIFRRGELVYRVPDIQESRACAHEQLGRAPPEILKFEKPRRYDVGLENSLHELRSRLIVRAEEERDRIE
jgi:nicotinate phosphoribosyltransferase